MPDPVQRRQGVYLLKNATVLKDAELVVRVADTVQGQLERDDARRAGPEFVSMRSRMISGRKPFVGNSMIAGRLLRLKTPAISARSFRRNTSPPENALYQQEMGA